MVSREVIQETVADYQKEIEQATIYPRSIFAQVEKTLQSEEVTVLTGIRRCGKTCLTYELLKKYPGVYINFENEKLINFSIDDFDKLFSLAIEQNKKILVLDEIQNIKGWEKFAARIHKKIKVFALGSNSSLLSSEFSSTLTGRTITIHVTPVSFGEFLEFKKLAPDNPTEKRAYLEKYLILGGFPRIVLSENNELISEYFNRIIYRDVIPRFGVQKPESLNRLALYLMSNNARPFSYRKLKEYCDLSHETTVKEYIYYLEQAYLLSTLNCFDPSLKRQELRPKKTYMTDTAFKHLGQTSDQEKGIMLENAVYLELNRKLKFEEKLYYYKNGVEVDFVLCEGLKPTTCYNVAYELETKETFDREVQGLLKIRGKLKTKDHYLISLYPPKFDIPRGIIYLDAAEFLLGV